MKKPIYECHGRYKTRYSGITVTITVIVYLSLDGSTLRISHCHITYY